MYFNFYRDTSLITFLYLTPNYIHNNKTVIKIIGNIHILIKFLY